MRKLKIMVILALLIVLAGASTFFIVGPGMIEKSMNTVVAHTPFKISHAAQKAHDELIIMDWHADSLLWNRNLLKRANFGHMDIPRLAEGNVALQMFTVVTKSPKGQNYESNTADSDRMTSLAIAQLWPPATWSSLYERALYQSHRLHEYASREPERLKIIRSQSDLIKGLQMRSKAASNGSGRMVLGLLGIEGCHCLEGKLENVQGLYDAGYRMISLHHFFDNELGGSLHGINREGLNQFGRQVVRELERLDIIIDVAHSSPEVVDDVLEIAKRPVVVSHTGMHGTCQSKRNLSDEQMQRIAAKGGLICIGYWDGAVCDIRPEGIVKSLRYAITRVGEDHVALGSDFDGSTTTAFDASELSVLTQTMMDYGFLDREIRKVMGGNSVRFLSSYLPK
jgi:microsomal dipeptidase-like Zn-dependent dipeptidase